METRNQRKDVARKLGVAPRTTYDYQARGWLPAGKPIAGRGFGHLRVWTDTEIAICILERDKAINGPAVRRTTGSRIRRDAAGQAQSNRRVGECQ